jgi:hypothetical protein
MRFYWIRDRVNQGQFRIHWKKGKVNLADYFSKHHPAKHHRDMRPKYLHVENEAVTGKALNCEGVLNTPKGILRSSLSSAPVQQHASPASQQPEQVLTWAGRLARSLPTSLENSSRLINLAK